MHQDVEVTESNDALTPTVTQALLVAHRSLGFVKYIHFKACNGSGVEVLFLTHTIPRSAWSGFAAVVALALSAESLGVSGQDAKTRPLPPGVNGLVFAS